MEVRVSRKGKEMATDVLKRTLQELHRVGQERSASAGRPDFA